jgi:hypothetical protein
MEEVHLPLTRLFITAGDARLTSVQLLRASGADTLSVANAFVDAFAIFGLSQSPAFKSPSEPRYRAVRLHRVAEIRGNGCALT